MALDAEAGPINFLHVTLSSTITSPEPNVLDAECATTVRRPSTLVEVIVNKYTSPTKKITLDK
jgi:hypothetical protein